LEISEVWLPFEGEEMELGLRNFAIRAFQAETFLKTIKNEQVWKKVCVRHFLMSREMFFFKEIGVLGVANRTALIRHLCRKTTV
jgi:hypothetical protein